MQRASINNLVLSTNDFQNPLTGYSTIIQWDTESGRVWAEVTDAIRDEIDEADTYKWCLDFGVQYCQSADEVNKILDSFLSNDAVFYYFQVS
jgi:hypothetical protein